MQWDFSSFPNPTGHTAHASTKSGTVMCREHVAEADVQTTCPLHPTTVHRDTYSVRTVFGEH